MAANRSVTVLAPNGRRQNVKITPNTTILQVLEEVCQKQGYSSKNWDIKHFNQVLEASLIFRFTGLPNNAQLEMVRRTNDRESANVTIGIQLENGQRLMGEFSSETMLMDIVRNLCPNEEKDNTVITYMHQEIHGAENLNTTSLQSLGLNNGRAMLRLLHRDLNKLATQAHVAGQLPSKPTKNNDKPRKGSNANTALQQAGTAASNVVSNVKNQVKKAFDPIAMLRNEKSGQGKNSRGSGKRFVGGGNVLGHGDRPEPEETSQPEVPQHEEGSSSKEEEQKCEEAFEAVEYLGARDALIFNQAEAKAIPRESLPENFYDLTVDDAKALLRDAKRQREVLEENPLLTNAQRELERTQAQLNKLHKYRKTIIRIQLPSQMVLQGIFGPIETVQHIKDFVQEYLQNSDKDFDLYVTPPKKILSPGNRLIDECLVPTAIIYYSGTSDLKPEVKTKLVDPKIASVQAIKSRISMTRSDSAHQQNSNSNIEHTNSDDNVNDLNAGSSGSGANANRISSYAPKWFKRAFK